MSNLKSLLNEEQINVILPTQAYMVKGGTNSYGGGKSKKKSKNKSKKKSKSGGYGCGCGCGGW